MDDTSRFRTHDNLDFSLENQQSIVFHVGAGELLKIAEDGFYIRGVKVPVDENEGKAVYKAIKQFLVESALRNPY